MARALQTTLASKRIVMRTRVIKSAVVYQVVANRTIIWQRHVSIGRTRDYSYRQEAAREQEQVARTYFDLGTIPKELDRYNEKKRGLL